MIQINLLPDEFRKKSRTPVKLMASIAMVVAINTGLVAWWAWLTFGVSAEIESERAVLQVEMDGLAPQVKYHAALDGERKRFASREATLAQITVSRILWTKKIDQLIDTINDGGEGQRHFIWLDDLNVTQSFDSRTKSAGKVRAAGNSGSDDVAHVANFLDDLEGSPFIEDFDPPAAPEGSETLVNEDLIPPIVWAFPLELSIKAREVTQ